MIRSNASEILRNEYGTLTYITGSILKFSPPVPALKRTLLSEDPGEYWKASALMLAAEMEFQAQRTDNTMTTGEGRSDGRV